MPFQSDDDIRATVAKRREAMAAPIPDNDPPPAIDTAASARDASANAWSGGHDYAGNPHRGARDLEAIKVGLLKRHISWPYDIDMDVAQFAAATLPKRLKGKNVDPETYAYLILTGEEWTEDEREVAMASSGAFISTQHDSVLWRDWYSKGPFVKAFKARLAEDASKAGTPDAGASGGDAVPSPDLRGGGGGKV